MFLKIGYLSPFLSLGMNRAILTYLNRKNINNFKKMVVKMKKLVPVIYEGS